MSYIIMALQEEGTEVRVCDYDTHERGFDTEAEAEAALERARTDYGDYREMWVEQLRDMQYWYWREQGVNEEYDLNEF